MASDARDRGIQICRVVGMILVVIGHACAPFAGHWHHYYFQSPDKILSAVYGFIYMFHMHLFFMISGFLWRKDRFTSIFDLIMNKAKRLLIPLISVFILYLMPIRFYTGWYEGVSDSLCVGYLLAIKNLDIGHLWFLLTLFLIFVLMWGIEEWVTNQFIANLIVITVYVVSYYIDIPFRIGEFLIYFWVSHILCVYHHDGWYLKKSRKKTLCILVLSLLACLVSLGIKRAFDGLIQYIGGLVFPIGIFVILYLLGDLIIKEHAKHITFIDELDQYSMGVYLFHEPFMYVLLYTFVSYFRNCYIFSAFLCVTSVLWSAIIVFVIKRMHCSFLIGEYSKRKY